MKKLITTILLFTILLSAFTVTAAASTVTVSKVTGLKVSVTAGERFQTVTLTWGAATTNAPNVQNMMGQSIREPIYYIVQQAEGNGSFQEARGSTFLGTTTMTLELDHKTTYRFRVRAYIQLSSDNFREIFGAWSDVITVKTSNQEFKGVINENSLQNKTSLTELEKAVLEIISIVPEDASDLEKITILFDWMRHNVEYDYDTYRKTNIDAYSGTAYGALVKRKAICGGYSLGYQLLLAEVGVESRYVLGELKDEEHAWNLVKLGNSWYHIEPQGTEGIYGSFLRSDEYFKNHKYSWTARTQPATPKSSFAIENRRKETFILLGNSAYYSEQGKIYRHNSETKRTTTLENYASDLVRHGDYLVYRKYGSSTTTLCDSRTATKTVISDATIVSAPGDLGSLVHIINDMAYFLNITENHNNDTSTMLFNVYDIKNETLIKTNAVSRERAAHRYLFYIGEHKGKLYFYNQYDLYSYTLKTNKLTKLTRPADIRAYSVKDYDAVIEAYQDDIFYKRIPADTLYPEFPKTQGIGIVTIVEQQGKTYLQWTITGEYDEKTGQDRVIATRKRQIT